MINLNRHIQCPVHKLNCWYHLSQSYPDLCDTCARLRWRDLTKADLLPENTSEFQQDKVRTYQLTAGRN